MTLNPPLELVVTVAHDGWDYAAVIARIVVGATTLLLAGVTYLLARQTKSAVKLTRADVAETRKTRIDASAPRATF